MKKVIILLTCIITLTACGGSGGKSANAPSTPAISTPPPLPTVASYQLADTQQLLTELENDLTGLTIDDFFEQSFLYLQQRNQQGSISDGDFANISVDNATLLDISDDYTRQTLELQGKVLTLLSQYDQAQLSQQQQLSYDIYYAYLNNQDKQKNFIHFDYPATYGFFGWPGSTEMFFTQAFTITNKEQADIYLALLNQVGRRFSQIVTLLDSRQAQGIIEPAITLNYSLEQIQNMANTAANQTSYYQGLQSQLNALDNITATDKQALLELAEQTVTQRVLPAYNALAEKIAEILPQAPQQIGFGQFEGGDEFYQFLLAVYTSSDMTAQQVHDLGLQELSRIRSEMHQLFTELNYDIDQPLANLYQQLEIEAGFIKAQEATGFYQSLIDDAYGRLHQAFSVLPTQQVVVIGGQTGGYYVSGSDDGSRPGAFYASTVNDVPYTIMPTLTYHEAVPGHHLQIALANELNLPTFQRKLGFTSFVEGWGLYAERLAKDLGWYQQDAYGDLGRLQFEAMRAARLVVDTGIHAMGWSYDQANQFHLENVGYNGSIARYSVIPGQATAYMTGMLKILELRAQAQAALGDKFNYPDFHAQVIGHGAMPLTILEQVIERYITTAMADN